VPGKRVSGGKPPGKMSHPIGKVSRFVSRAKTLGARISIDLQWHVRCGSAPEANPSIDLSGEREAIVNGR
jgi:hypothetical protein